MTPAELLTELAACLCAALTPDGADGPDLCSCGVLHGDIVAYPDCADSENCGAAWVRLVNSYPSVSVGEQATSENSCGAFLGMDIELGVVRCVPDGDQYGGPTQAQLSEIATKALEDMVAMRRAVKCCDALDDVDYVLGAYRPTGPRGKISGGTWSLSVIL